MSWEGLIEAGLEVALNEAEVVGLLHVPEHDAVDILIHVMALPTSGPIDPDGRRVLRLLAPQRIQVLLRRETVDGFGPALPISDLDEVDQFFESLSWGGSISGWKFFDNPQLVNDWPSAPSLTIELRPTPGAHTFHWFNECGRTKDEGSDAFCIEGTVTFDGLTVLRADGGEQPIEEFIGDGRRCWDALFSRDERMSSEAQHRFSQVARKWRSWAAGSDATLIEGT